MVRVINVHHFSSQSIHSCEDPIAVTVAPPDRLLLALQHQVIEVRDLQKNGDILFTFPTVDEVYGLVHCCNGNYVATLESKQTRQGKQTSYARIYSNWDISSNSGTDRESEVLQPMRARIAGRVTPSSAQLGVNGLEMIELPTKRTPSALACCQVTGNLVLASHKTLTLYYFQVRLHDISRLKFIDFEESPITLDLSFCPTKLELCEDVIACMSKENLHVIQIGHMENDWIAKRMNNCMDNFLKGKGGKKTGRRTENVAVEWDDILSHINEKNSFENSGVLLDTLHQNSFPLTVCLPNISSEQAGGNVNALKCDGAFYRQCPFYIQPVDMGIHIRSSSPSVGRNQDARIWNLLQLQSKIPVIAENSMYEGGEEFRCLVLKPLYINVNTQGSERDVKQNHPMRSTYYRNLACIMCLVATQHEGYLYNFSMMASRGPMKLQQAACITVYTFTAPVSCIALENHFLHALTDTGLETYTLRIGHHHLQEMYMEDSLSASPHVNDPVCLVGLRPFLGVEHLLVSNSFVSLLACSENSSISSQDSHSANWTLYSLQIPKPTAIYNDIMAVASTHRWSSPTTYYHLVSEAHIILWLSLNSIHWCLKSDHAVDISVPHFDTEERLNLEELFKESCKLLGDYYISGENKDDWQLANPYYTMSGLTPLEVVERVKHLEMPKENANINKENQIQGLMQYLKSSLLLMSQGSNVSSYSPEISSFTSILLDLFEENNPSEVSSLVLKSAILREFATDRVLAIMKSLLFTRSVPEPSDALALVLLCIQKGSPEQAIAVLNSLTAPQLIQILLENNSLLFDLSPVVITQQTSRRSATLMTFSELAIVLMDAKPNVLAEVLYGLVTSDKENMDIQQVLQVFLEYLPSRIGFAGSAGSLVMQKFLEKYFSWYFVPNANYHGDKNFDAPTKEAMKILVRSYLSDLQCYDHNNKSTTNGKKTSRMIIKSDSSSQSDAKSEILFANERFLFLQKMPPFSPNLSKRLMLLQAGTKEEAELAEQTENTDNYESLVKLQSLLCSGKLPKECLMEVFQFVQTNPQLQGNLSLQVLCLPPKEGTHVLLNFCPQALLQFSQDKFQSESEWKFMLMLFQKKIQSLSDDSLLKPFYMQLLKECLTHLAQTLPISELHNVLPPDTDSSYQNFIQICQQVGHANHIQALITTTGQQLLASLNL